VPPHRAEFETLLAENAAKPEAERLPRSAFEIDVGLREMVGGPGASGFSSTLTITAVQVMCPVCLECPICCKQLHQWFNRHNDGKPSCGCTHWHVACLNSSKQRRPARMSYGHFTLTPVRHVPVYKFEDVGLPQTAHKHVSCSALSLLMQVQAETARREEAARKELAWETEKRRLALTKLRAYFLDQASVQRMGGRGAMVLLRQRQPGHFCMHACLASFCAAYRSPPTHECGGGHLKHIPPGGALV
jgi:hypothetical protein